ncbi:MAG: hypothetical protein ACE5SW_10530 [Nitrososphaeraceae archaeon]
MSSFSISNMYNIHAQENEDPLQIISYIRTLLNQTMTEYKSANYTGASELIDIAYIDNYEYIEEPLRELDKELMEETELLIREDFSNAINDKESSENINNLYNNILNNLDMIEDQFRKN